MIDDPGVRPDAFTSLDAMPDGLGHWLLNQAGTAPPEGVVATVTGDDTKGYTVSSDHGAVAAGPYPSLDEAVAAVEKTLLTPPSA